MTIYLHNIIYITLKEIKFTHSIGSELAFKLKKENKVIFIDVRRKEFYLQKRIKDSYSLPINKMSEWEDILNKKVINGKIIITYCDSYSCKLSAYAADFLIKLGYENVFYLLGGIEEWEKRGYPMEYYY